MILALYLAKASLMDVGVIGDGDFVGGGGLVGSGVSFVGDGGYVGDGGGLVGDGGSVGASVGASVSFCSGGGESTLSGGGGELSSMNWHSSWIGIG